MKPFDTDAEVLGLTLLNSILGLPSFAKKNMLKILEQQGIEDLDANTWFTEISDRDGSAFSLRINKKLESKQSPFQLVEMYETTDFGNLMIIDGCTMVSTRENFFYHEMMSHPALFSHPAPKNVVIIGGGDCGTLREVLKHPDIETVHQIDIDEEKAADLVTKASDLFRYNLMSSKTADAKLSDELGSLTNYLELLEEQKRAPCSYSLKLHDAEISPNIPSMSLIFICSFLLNTARKRDGELTIASFIKHQKYRIEIAHQSHGKFFLDTEHFDNVKSRLEHQYNNDASIVLVKSGKRRKVVIELPIDWQQQLEKTA